VPTTDPNASASIPAVPVSAPPSQGTTALMAANNQTTVPKPPRSREHYTVTTEVVSDEDDETVNATAKANANLAKRGNQTRVTTRKTLSSASKCHSASASSSKTSAEVQSPPSKKEKAQETVQRPPSFGKYVWAQPIILRRKVNHGDQDLMLCPLKEVDEFINDPNVEYDKFIEFCDDKGVPFGFVKQERLDPILRELMKRVLLLREGVIDDRIWKPLSEPVYCGMHKDVVVLILLILYCYPEDDDKNLRTALLFCIGRLGYNAASRMINDIDSGKFKYPNYH